MSYVNTGQERTKQREYNEDVVTRSNVDSYTERTPLAFADTRPLITDPHDTRELRLVIHGNDAITLTGTDVIELTVLLHRVFDNLQAQDITVAATWDTSAAGVATVVNGTVTAVAAGTAEITVTFNEIVSNIITITVV